MMKKLLSTTLLAMIGYGSAAMADTITYGCGPNPQDNELCDWYDAKWKEITNGEHDSKRVTMPFQTEQQLNQLQQMFAAKSDAIEVIRMDVIWPGLLKDHLLDLGQYGATEASAKHIEGYIKNNTVDGKLKALPLFLDTGVLFYRTDLLEKYNKPVPTTWEEMAITAEEIMKAERVAGNEDMWGFVFQGKAYEGLTCDALEWVSSFGGGQIVEDDGSISINNPKAAAALDAAGSWVGKISPEGVTGFTEEEARKAFQSGNVVFQRNWPYVLGLGNGDDSPIKGKIGVAPLPHGPDGRSSSTLGGWSVGVNKYTSKPELAARFATMITDEEAQRNQYDLTFVNPTITSLYEEPSFEDIRIYLPVFENAQARPSSPTGPRYNEVSSEFWNSAHTVLSGDKDGATAVKELEKRLKGIKKRSRDWTR